MTQRTANIVACSLIALVFLFSFLFAFALFSLRHELQFQFGKKKPDVSAVTVLIDITNKAIHVTKVLAYGDPRWRRLDLTSVGAPAKESRLVELRLLLGDYKHDFGRYPASASELTRLESRESLRGDQRDVLESGARECRVFASPRDGYLLNCDGWRPTGANSTASLITSFNAATEKFYAAQGHVFLYAPPRNSP